MIQTLRIDVHSHLELTLVWAALRKIDSEAVHIEPRLFRVLEEGPSQVTTEPQIASDERWIIEQACDQLALIGYDVSLMQWTDLRSKFPALQGAPAEWEALALMLEWLQARVGTVVSYDMLPWPVADARQLVELLGLCKQLDIKLDSSNRSSVSTLALTFLGAFGRPNGLPGLQLTGYAQALDRDRAPALTVALCVQDDEQDTVCVLSANIDDQNPELYQYCQERLFAAGALDVLLQPIYMKKQRPGTLFTVIGKPVDKDKLVGIILEETSTLGVRCIQAERVKLLRTTRTVSLPWGEVAVKLGFRAGKLMNVAPEYDDCRRVAESNHIPAKLVYQQALANFWQTWDTGDSI